MISGDPERNKEAVETLRESARSRAAPQVLSVITAFGDQEWGERKKRGRGKRESRISHF